jgi:hypothetical protein
VNLRALNTHAVGYTGLGVGAAGIIAAVSSLFALLSNPTFLFDLYTEAATRHLGKASFTFFAALFAIVGALVVALLYAWLGRPPTIAADPPAAK